MILGQQETYTSFDQKKKERYTSLIKKKERYTRRNFDLSTNKIILLTLLLINGVTERINICPLFENLYTTFFLLYL